MTAKKLIEKLQEIINENSGKDFEIGIEIVSISGTHSSEEVEEVFETSDGKIVIQGF